MAALRDLKESVRSKVASVASFSDATVLATRPVEPETMPQQVVAKLKGLSAFVWIQSIGRGSSDYDPSKSVEIMVELWMKPLALESDDVSAPLTVNGRNAEDLLEDVIDTIESMATETFADGTTKQRLAFQSAERISDVPNPFLVYRINSRAETIIGDNLN